MRLVPQERIPALLQGAHYDPSIPEAEAEACCKLKVSKLGFAAVNSSKSMQLLLRRRGSASLQLRVKRQQR